MRYLKNPRIVSAAVGATLLCSVFGVAGFAQAASLNTVQIQSIINLLQAFGADPGTISNVQAVLEGQTPTAPANDNGSSSAMSTSTLPNGCTVLSNGLHIGSSDKGTEGDVTRLQQFLSKDSSIYPEGLVTGYFGPATEDAVRRWQAVHGVVATGTPATTGFGMLGPQTRGEMDREMETECEHGDMQRQNSTSDNQGGDTQASSTLPGGNGGDN